LSLSHNNLENLESRFENVTTLLNVKFIKDNFPSNLAVVIMTTTSLKTTNSVLSKLIGKVSYKDHKRTQQEVSDALLSYLYNRYMVYTNNKYIYPNIYMLFMSLLHYFHKVKTFSNVIVLDPFTIF